jgi:hypothetical protein
MEARVEEFFEARCRELENENAALQFDCAELDKKNGELFERVKTLANRAPAWPKGYRPHRRIHEHNHK